MEESPPDVELSSTSKHEDLVLEEVKRMSRPMSSLNPRQLPQQKQSQNASMTNVVFFDGNLLQNIGKPPQNVT